MLDIRNHIEKTILAITPYDEQEKGEIEKTLAWVRSGADIFQSNQSDIPFMHLVCYFPLIDFEKKSFLLTDHKKAKLYLPPGGHVELNERPRDAVSRELLEELGVTLPLISQDPFFLTITKTYGIQKPHVDVSLWYLLEAKMDTPLCYDPQEFEKIGWYSWDEIPEPTHPDMDRFIAKLKNRWILRR